MCIFVQYSKSIPYQPIALDCCFFLGSMVGIDGVAALTILALRLCSHCVVIGRPAQARNALLAAYFILDDDGVRGLSREQLVGVLTTEAGVGIDTDQVGWWASEDNSLFSHTSTQAPWSANKRGFHLGKCLVRRLVQRELDWRRYYCAALRDSSQSLGRLSLAAPWRIWRHMHVLERTLKAGESTKPTKRHHEIS